MKTNKGITVSMASIVQGWSTSFFCTVVAMEDCPPYLDTLCKGAAWPCAYFAPPYSVLYLQAD